MTGEPDDIRVSLVRIQGGIDIANERLTSVQVEVAGLRNRVHDHGNEITRVDAKVERVDAKIERLIAERKPMVEAYTDFKTGTETRVTGLEHWRASVQGERKGLTASGRVAWAILSLLAGSGLVGIIVELVK